MNTVGVVLSASALLVALVELRLRADLPGRRMCAMLVTCSWLTMSGVAWDCNRHYIALLEKQTTHHVQAVLLKQGGHLNSDGFVVPPSPYITASIGKHHDE